MESETVLITGASSGIGLELAKLFATDKSNLVLVARSQDKLEKLADELRKTHGVEVVVVVADLSDPAAPKAIYDQLDATGITIDVLVNNAGFGILGPLADSKVDEQMGMVQVNMAALTHLSHLFLPGMVERKRGGILNVGSVAGFLPGPNMAVYYATKAYVLHFSEGLAEEVRDKGVTVTCLTPGPTETSFGQVSGMDKTSLFQKNVMGVEAVAKAGHRGFRKGKVIVTPGIRNKMTPLFIRLGPRWLVRKIAKGLQS
ncbi:MAG: SDR family NAD(P)-dependent oxidoreductase [Gemmataceae bacterium]